MSTEPEYLGDGVYASQEPGFPLVLTTGDHHPARADNVIYFEPQVMDALWMRLERIRVNK